MSTHNTTDVQAILSSIEARVAALEARSASTNSVIASFAPAPITVLKNIPVTIRLDDGAYVASFVDANINASGETELEAFEMLKDQIAWFFQRFNEIESQLGEHPGRQLAVLREFVASR